MDSLIKKGLRLIPVAVLVMAIGLNGFPDQEGIKTRAQCERYLTGEPEWIT